MAVWGGDEQALCGGREDTELEAGDTVVFGKYSGTEIEIKGDTHLIVRESELLGLIDA